MSGPLLTVAGKDYALKWSLLARYRLQSLKEGATFADLSNPDRALKAVADFAWAALPPTAPFATPAALVAALDDAPDGFDRLDTAVSAMFEASFPQGEAAEAKKASTDSSPAPASSSV